MSLSLATRAVGTLFMAGALSACVDLSINLDVVDANNGVGTTTIAMDRQFYDMSQQNSGGGFCEDDGELTLTETTATCVTTQSGTFDELFAGSDPSEPTPSIATLDNGQVKVTFPTGSLVEQASEAGSDPETLAQMASYFENHFFSISVSGGQVVDTNMNIAEDGQSASLTVPILDMIKGEVDLPDEAYAVLQLN